MTDSAISTNFKFLSYPTLRFLYSLIAYQFLFSNKARPLSTISFLPNFSKYRPVLSFSGIRTPLHNQLFEHRSALPSDRVLTHSGSFIHTTARSSLPNLFGNPPALSPKRVRNFFKNQPFIPLNGVRTRSILTYHLTPHSAFFANPTNSHTCHTMALTGESQNTHSSQLTPQQKLDSLRTLMKNHEIDAYFVNTGDQHDNENVDSHDSRRIFISGFTGSAGYGLVTLDTAMLWVDGRYFVQAEKQLDSSCWKLMKLGMPGTISIYDYISKSVKAMGFDSFTTPTDVYLKMKETSKDKVKIVPFKHSLIDEVWGSDQPPHAYKPIIVFPEKFTGQSTKNKVEKIQSEFSKNSVSAILVSQLDEIAWTLNLRGADIYACPIFFSYLLIGKDFINLYVNKEQLTKEASDTLTENNVTVKAYEDMLSDLKEINFNEENKIWLDTSINAEVYSQFTEKAVHLKSTPILLAKSIKNEAELNGMKEAHIKDAMAEVKFFTWIESVKNDQTLFTMNEFELSQKMDFFREQHADFISVSFPTIAGIGKNASVIHYRPTEEDSQTITPSMFLLDSGGQYKWGTTDITRTTHFGEPTEYEKQCFTYVMKGHIAISEIVFPETTKGPYLDILARQFLWTAGLDYMHGTGHGVGACLNVHEGPCSISPQFSTIANLPTLVPGMVISNEPGYYDYDLGFGIRLENLVYVKDAGMKHTFGDKKFYKFENLTYVPFDTKLLDKSLLTQQEINWINNYHKEVKEKITAAFNADEEETQKDHSEAIEWLAKATQAI